MKRINHIFLFIVICVLIMFIGCGVVQQFRDSDEVSMKEYYRKEDFNAIIIGKSTYQDVYNIAPLESMQVTSYGAFCEYPTQMGGYIRIKFYGRDMIVGAIEEVLSSESE